MDDLSMVLRSACMRATSLGLTPSAVVGEALGGIVVVSVRGEVSGCVDEVGRWKEGKLTMAGR